MFTYRGITSCRKRSAPKTRDIQTSLSGIGSRSTDSILAMESCARGRQAVLTDGTAAGPLLLTSPFPSVCSCSPAEPRMEEQLYQPSNDTLPLDRYISTAESW